MENREESHSDDHTDDETEEEDKGENQAPYDSEQITITRRAISLNVFITRLERNEFNLSPDFQREKNLWSDAAQSRLIESLLLRIPIPAFYFDATGEDRWAVIDGVQRLTVFARFFLNESVLKEAHLKLEKLTLQELEFLTDLNGKTFEELDRADQRKFEETDLTVYTVTHPTPKKVKYNIFKRINTGGLGLSDQEIRNAFHAGKATAVLDELAKSSEFLEATHNAIDPSRKEAHECVLRFVAFTLPIAAEYKAYEKPDFDQLIKEYRKQEYDQFLRDTMDRMNNMSEDQLDQLKKQFKEAMKAAHEIFDEYAFRKLTKRHQKMRYRDEVNHALFEVWSVHLGQLPDTDRLKLIEKKEYVINKFAELLRVHDFSNALSHDIIKDSQVETRFKRVEGFINEILQAQDSWENIEDNYYTGARVSGTVLDITGSDTLIELEAGVLGVIPASELSWTRRYLDPRKCFKWGDAVDGVVLEVDLEAQQVILSYKQTKPDPWPDFLNKYGVDSIVRGEIVKIVPFGAFAKLEDDIDGLIHISELAPRWVEGVEDVVSVGDKLELMVIKIDRNRRKIDLSLKAVFENPPHARNDLDNPPTLLEEKYKEAQDRHTNKRKSQ